MRVLYRAWSEEAAEAIRRLLSEAAPGWLIGVLPEGKRFLITVPDDGRPLPKTLEEKLEAIRGRRL